MTGERSVGRGLVDAIPDLEYEEPEADFEEPFYLVVLERTVQGTTVHMWRLIIASQPESNRKFFFLSFFSHFSHNIFIDVTYFNLINSFKRKYDVCT